MTNPPLDHAALRKLAEEAEAAYSGKLDPQAVVDFAETVTPSVVLALLDEVEELRLYRLRFVAAVEKAADVFSEGGPLSHLVEIGQSVLMDGPKAAAAELARLTARVAELEGHLMKLQVKNVPELLGKAPMTDNIAARLREALERRGNVEILESRAWAALKHIDALTADNERTRGERDAWVKTWNDMREQRDLAIRERDEARKERDELQRLYDFHCLGGGK